MPTAASRYPSPNRFFPQCRATPRLEDNMTSLQVLFSLMQTLAMMTSSHRISCFRDSRNFERIPKRSFFSSQLHAIAICHTILIRFCIVFCRVFIPLSFQLVMCMVLPQAIGQAKMGQGRAGQSHRSSEALAWPKIPKSHCSSDSSCEMGETSKYNRVR